MPLVQESQSFYRRMSASRTSIPPIFWQQDISNKELESTAGNHDHHRSGLIMSANKRRIILAPDPISKDTIPLEEIASFSAKVSEKR